MNLCTETITVFHASLDQKSRMTTYSGTAVSGVSWFRTTKVTTSTNGLLTADVVIIRIPAENYPAGLEIANGDYIVKGAGEWPGTADLRRVFGEVGKVMGVTDNRRTGVKAPHVKVVCA